MPSYGFHSEAAEEYLSATRHFLDHASPLVAAAFVAEIEDAIRALLASPTIWAVIDEPQIRCYLLRRFPYSVYYRWGKRSETAFPFMPSCIPADCPVTGIIVSKRLK